MRLRHLEDWYFYLDTKYLIVDFWKSIFIFFCADIFVTTRRMAWIEMSIFFTVKNKKFTRKSRNAFLHCVNAVVFCEDLNWIVTLAGRVRSSHGECRHLPQSGEQQQAQQPEGGGGGDVESGSAHGGSVSVRRQSRSLWLILIQSLSQVHHLALL